VHSIEQMGIFFGYCPKERKKEKKRKKPFVVTKQFLSFVSKFNIIKIPSFDDWQKYGKNTRQLSLKDISQWAFRNP